MEKLVNYIKNNNLLNWIRLYTESVGPNSLICKKALGTDGACYYFLNGIAFQFGFATGGEC